MGTKATGGGTKGAVGLAMVRLASCCCSDISWWLMPATEPERVNTLSFVTWILALLACYTSPILVTKDSWTEAKLSSSPSALLAPW